MTEDLNLTSEDLPMPDKAESVSAFWEHEGVPKEIEIQPYYQKMILENFVIMRLEPLSTKSAPTELDRKFLQNRNQAILATKGWVPGLKQAEVSTAQAGAVNKLKAAYGTKHGNPDSAATGTYNKITGFWRDAEYKKAQLERGLIQNEQGQSVPNIKLIRQLLGSDPQFMNVYRDYFWAKQNLDHYQWRKNVKANRKLFEGAALEMASLLNSELLGHAHIVMLQDMKNRLRFWGEQIAEADTLDFIDKLRADPDSRLASINTPRSFEKNQAHEPRHATLKHIGELITEEGFGKMPEDIRKAQVAKYEDAQRQIDKLVENGIFSKPQAEINILGTPGIYIDGVLIGQEPPDERRTRKEAYSVDGRPPYRKRGFGIVADTEQNDPKVKDTYSGS